jgi:hypothetical protein
VDQIDLMRFVTTNIRLIDILNENEFADACHFNNENHLQQSRSSSLFKHCAVPSQRYDAGKH